MSQVIFFVGAPGVGKTTLIRQFIEPDSYFVMKPKWTVGSSLVAAGHYTGGAFDGADTVPYNGVKDALAYWGQKFRGVPRTVFDGDRFSHGGVVDFFDGLKVEMVCIQLFAEADVLVERRAGRGSHQNATWMKGRLTKAINFAAAFAARKSLIQIGAEGPPEEVFNLVKVALG